MLVKLSIYNARPGLYLTSAFWKISPISTAPGGSQPSLRCCNKDAPLRTNSSARPDVEHLVNSLLLQRCEIKSVANGFDNHGVS